MQTNLLASLLNTPEGQEADRILRSCVHCGFCNATCPTYQLTGDELDGPRGRIYLIKQLMEGDVPTRSTQLHLDRCLTCRNCETTCPSGVQYARLLDIGKGVVDKAVARSPGKRLARALLGAFLPRSSLFGPAFRAGQFFRPLLPSPLRAKLPLRQPAKTWPTRKHLRSMLLLDGCVQPAMAPTINAAAARVLDALGIALRIAPKAGCCGAIRHHLDDRPGALDEVRCNIDAWWPLIAPSDGKPIEAIVSTASGCGLMVKDYGHLLRHDTLYAAKAERVSALAKDLSEIFDDCSDTLAMRITPAASKRRVAFHPPCTLQHGQRIEGKIELLLKQAGYVVSLCDDSHLCCGSAGTYSLLQPDFSLRLRDMKLEKLKATEAEVIVSANIGCLLHLQSGTAIPVRHWIELIDEVLAERGAGPFVA